MRFQVVDLVRSDTQEYRCYNESAFVKTYVTKESEKRKLLSGSCGRGAIWRICSRKITWRTPYLDGEPIFSSRKYLVSWRTWNHFRELYIIFGEMLVRLREAITYLAN